MISSPQCGPGSGTSKKRRIGYYQGWNTRERKCDKVSPKQINTRGLTHLFFSFAFFNPTTFEMTPMHEGDLSLYKEFTDLKTNNLQTWIAVGGVSAVLPHMRHLLILISGRSTILALINTHLVIWCPRKPIAASSSNLS
jgi:GH18 family chitinase